ncbi:MAG TPA: hypothetical protein VGR62_06175 [Candidatus Binatia bacterium]|nr:hypothetical protein [Candidatus Binatia bacterium]
MVGSTVPSSSTTIALPSSTTTTTLAEAFAWEGFWSFIGTRLDFDACPWAPTTIVETVRITGVPVGGLQILCTGDITMNPCGEGGVTDDGGVACFHDLSPAEVLSARAFPPTDGKPATLTVGWRTAYETDDDCRAFWSGTLVRIDQPISPP